MKAIGRILPALLLIMVALPLSTGCLVEEKIIELVLTGETSAEFSYNDTDEVFEDTETIEIGQKIADILADAGLAREEVGSAHLVGVDYEVTAFQHTHDWEISGAITIERDGSGSFADLIFYTSQSVQEALKNRQAAPLEAPGVALIQGALEDFLDGASPQLTLRVENGDVVPDPSQGDPIVFTWEVTLTLQITAEQSLDVPDPF